jgi:hypothetical protein
MDWPDVIQEVLFGFLLAIPFVWIKQYVLRTALSIFVPLAIHWWALWVLSDPVHFRIDRRLFFIVVGSLCAAHVKLLWSFVWKRIRPSSA